MRRRYWLYATLAGAVLLLGMSATPRYLEELRIGGGYGAADGGLDIEASGDLATDGEILAEGDITARGRVVAGTGGHVLTTPEGLLDGGKLLDGSVSDAKVSETLTIGSGGSVDVRAVDITAAPEATAAADTDTLLIHAATAGETRQISRGDFLAGVSGLWSDGDGYIYPNNAPDVHIDDGGNMAVPGSLEVRGAHLSVGTATGTSYLVKGKFEGSDTLVFTDRSALEGHVVWSGGPHSASNIQGVVGRATVGTGYSASGTEIIGVRGLSIAGPSFSQVGRSVGLKGQVVLTQPGAIVDGMVLYGGVAGSAGTISNLYGLYIEDITLGSASNYAVHTGLGKCHFGDDVHIAGDAAIAGALSTPAVVTFAANDNTPSVAGANLFRVPETWTAGNDVTDLDDGTTGQLVIVLGGNADCVFADSGNLVLAGPWTAHPGSTLVLVHVDGVWHELSRSGN